MDKRNLLKLMVSTAGIATLSPYIKNFARQSINEESVLLSNDLQYVAEHWMKHEGSFAGEYLAKINLSEKLNELNSLITNDFKNNNTYTINGLVLSKTEVAIMAYLGSTT